MTFWSVPETLVKLSLNSYFRKFLPFSLIILGQDSLRIFTQVKLQRKINQFINFPSLFVAIFLHSVEQNGVQRLSLVTTLIISSLKEIKLNKFYVILQNYFYFSLCIKKRLYLRLALFIYLFVLLLRFFIF